MKATGASLIGEMSIRNIIRRAYDLQELQLQGPEWLSSELFNIDARLPDGAHRDQVPAMLQALLKERFKFQAHTDVKTLRGFALVVAKGGSKMSSTKSSAFAIHPDQTGRHILGGMTISILAGLLSEDLQRPVADETGLSGDFAVKLDYMPDTQVGSDRSDIRLSPPLNGALQEQLGLALEPRNNEYKFLVVEHIERVPTQN